MIAEAENRPKSAHRYNVAEQQNVYKSEIERIWKAQYRSLSRKDEPQLTAEDEARFDAQKQQEKQSGFQRNKPRLEDLESAPSAASLAGPSRERQRSISPHSRASSLDREVSLGPESSTQVLRIKRFVDGEWETEIVRDPAVIRAYVRRRQMIEEESATADSLAPTGDEERDKRARKRLEEEIARMKKNQERRLHRKNARITKEGGTPLVLNRPLKPDTTRKCGHCGQMGHMSKSCHSYKFQLCSCTRFSRNEQKMPSLGRVQFWCSSHRRNTLHRQPAHAYTERKCIVSASLARPSSPPTLSPFSSFDILYSLPATHELVRTFAFGDEPTDYCYGC